MTDLLSSHPLQLLTESLLHFLWQGTLLFLLLKLAARLLRSPQDRHAALLSGMVLMLMMPVATCFILLRREAPLPAETLSAAEAADDFLNASGAQPTHELPVRLRQGQPVLVGLWLLGVIGLAARLLVGFAGTLWLRKDRRGLPAELAQRVNWLGQRLGVVTRGRVFLSTRVEEAIAVGCLKPLVLVPLAWANELPPSMLEAVIAHELAHIRRWDLWTTLLQRLAETLLFYHPAVWWVSRQLTIERELCCDALAVEATQRRADYALALEIVARRRNTPPLGLATSFLGGGNMHLLERVRNVLRGPAREGTSWWPAGLAALAIPAVAALALGGWSPLVDTAIADDESAEQREAEERRSEEVVEQARQEVESLVKELDRRLAEERERAKEKDRKGDREVKREREGDEERKEDSPKKEDVRRDKEDIDFTDFRPQTEREERLLAIIRKLQAQLKESKPGKKDAEANYEYKRAVEAKTKDAAAEKDAAIRKEQEMKRAYELDYKQQIEAKTKAAAAEKDAAIRKEQEAKRAYELEHKKAVEAKLEAVERAGREKEAANRKERDPKTIKGYEKVSDKEALLRKAQEEFAVRKDGDNKEAMIKKLREAKEKGIDKEAAARKDEESKKKVPDDIESLRRALKEQQAQLQKTAEALERLQGSTKKDGAPSKKEKKTLPKDSENLKKIREGE